VAARTKAPIALPLPEATPTFVAPPEWQAIDFISDLHLAASTPRTFDAWAAHLRHSRADAVFILGDLFEVWVGDDLAERGFEARCVEVLREAAAGKAIAFMAGNRDFLVGGAFADAARLERLPDPYRTRIGGVELLLSHGDALCVDDVDYQRFRATVRDPRWQEDFLARPLAERRAVIAGAREQSEAAKRGKAAASMDANDGAVGELLAEHPGAVLIHGHTHRPARHEPSVDDAQRERWVLTDWDAEASPPRGGGLALAGGRIVQIDLPPPD
jgi:UDP-2,3-diacylglucosamine hydrolase